MLVKFRLIWLILGGLSVSGLVQAQVVPGLYEARIVVENQNRDIRKEAIRSGLQDVLVRVSGRLAVLDALNLPDIARALDNATRFAQQFRYQSRKVIKSLEDGTSQPAVEQVLWVKFDEQAVDKLLRSNNLPVWGHTRPVTLVWLVVDSQGSRDLLNTHSTHQARELIQNHAQLRGLPVQLPFYDLTDRASLSVSDVWGNFEEAIMRTSMRYQPEAVLVGRMFQADTNIWQARWTLYQNGQRQDWDVNGESVLASISPAIDNTAETLAMRFAAVNEEQQSDQTMIQISGIRGMPAYNRVVKYLQSLSTVSSVAPQMVMENKTVFKLQTHSGRLALAQAIALGHVLVPEDTQQVTGEVARGLNAEMFYRLLQ